MHSDVPFSGTNYLEFECFALNTGLQFALKGLGSHPSSAGLSQNTRTVLITYQCTNVAYIWGYILWFSQEFFFSAIYIWVRLIEPGTYAVHVLSPLLRMFFSCRVSRGKRTSQMFHLKWSLGMPRVHKVQQQMQKSLRIKPPRGGYPHK